MQYFKIQCHPSGKVMQVTAKSHKHVSQFVAVSERNAMLNDWN
jgi:hypothetical protein